QAEALATENGGSLTITHDRGAALRDAHVVYAKSWGSLATWGNAEAESTQRAPLRDWCVTEASMPPQAHFMHCLPVRRNVIATDAVLDGPNSLILEQAENRLHAQTALLETLLS
ncbi:MAG: acetylornithine carbamoyltransferase, partial [Planctomycetes bacterium]|nr:acetylornithine carbamoyltransferase [Planctomycetota bacterium]